MQLRCAGQFSVSLIYVLWMSESSPIRNDSQLSNKTWRSKEWCVSSARADWLIATCHWNLGDMLNELVNWLWSLYGGFPQAHFSWWGCYGYVSDMNQPSLPTLFYSVLVSVSVFTTLSTVFHSVNSPDNSPISLSVLLVLILLFLVLPTLYLFMGVPLSPEIILCGCLGLKRQLTN